MSSHQPTTLQYAAMGEAYRYFNKHLFSELLPECLITHQRKAGSYGYFAGGRFGSTHDQTVTDEIAMNPSYFRERTSEEILSTLVHEMAHLWQHHYGKPSLVGYHNSEWATKMQEIGLIPSDTGQPGGKPTGQRMTHYIAENGRFYQCCSELLGKGFVIPFVDLWVESKATKSKAKNKTKFICESCEAAAWGKPNLRILCVECEQEMIPDL